MVEEPLTPNDEIRNKVLFHFENCMPVFEPDPSTIIEEDLEQILSIIRIKLARFDDNPIIKQNILQTVYEYSLKFQTFLEPNPRSKSKTTDS